VAPAARGLGLRGDRSASSELVRLLKADAPFVQLAAAEALARCGEGKPTVEALWQALDAKPDRFLEHAVIHALHRLAETPALESALKSPSPRVRKAALVLLDQPPRPRDLLKPEPVIEAAKSSDPELRQTALRILQNHLEWADQAVGLLRGWLEKPALTAEEQVGLRSLILAFQGQKNVQDLVAATLTGRASAARQVLVLEALSQTSLPKLPLSWTDALSGSLKQADPAVRKQAVRTAAVLQLPQLDDALAKLAESKEEPVDLRLESLRAIVLRRPKLSAGVFALLIGQLDAKASPLNKLAAAEVLGRAQLAEAQMTALLKAARTDTLLAPAVLLPAFQRSVSAETAPALLDYLGEALKNGWRPSEAELNKVIAALPAATRDKAGPVRELWKKGIAQQRAKLAEFEPLLTGGSAERGRKVFFSQKVPCATCHRVGTEGGDIGPDLTKIGAIRAGRDILESIVLPSSTIAQGYEPYVVTTKDGRVLTGIVARQTADTLVLRDSSGAELRLRRDQIDEMSRGTTSIMPEGLEKQMTKEEFRDLLAYLLSLK